MDAADSTAPGSSAGDTGSNQASKSTGCPICEFIEAGPCGSQHEVWVACRGEAKEKDTDYVQHCGDSFRTFFGCMLSHQDYYKPFLEAFQVDTDRSQEAIDRADARKQPQEQQQQEPQMHTKAALGTAAEQQQHSKNKPVGLLNQTAKQQPAGDAHSGGLTPGLQGM